MEKSSTEKPKERFVFIFLGLFFGALGLHNFYAGYHRQGIIKLGVTGTCILLNIVLAICCAITGINSEQGTDNIPFLVIVLGISWGATPLILFALWVWSIIELFTVKTDAKGIELKPLD